MKYIKKLIILISLIVVMLFIGCEFPEAEKPIIEDLGIITGIKSYNDGAFSSATCIVIVNNSLDVKFKGYYCNIAEEGKHVIKQTYLQRGGGYSYKTVE